MASTPCGICLKPNQTLISISLECEDNLTLLTKLQVVAPFHDWLNCYSICQNCKNLLDTSYRFIEMCRKFEKNDEKHLQRVQENKFLPEDDMNWKESDFEDGDDEEKVEANDIDQEHSDIECITVQFEESDEGISSSISKDKSATTDMAKNSDFQCPLCDQTFSSMLSLEMHSRFVEHGQKCRVCSEVFKDEESLETHFSSDHPGHTSEFTCEVCNEVFLSVNMLIRHCEKDHTMERNKIRPYSCGLCHKRLASLTSFKRHLSYHEGIRHFTCTFCGKSFIMKEDLKVHELIHLNEKKYRCEKCDKNFNTHSNFRSHRYVSHTDPSKWNYGCGLCPKRFPWKQQLTDHVKRHKGIKEHQCVACGSCFTTKYDMDRHMYFHTKDRPHKCQFCPGKSYRDRKRLEVHINKCHSLESDVDN